MTGSFTYAAPRSPRGGTPPNRRDGHGWTLNRENAVLILPRMVHPPVDQPKDPTMIIHSERVFCPDFGSSRGVGPGQRKQTVAPFSVNLSGAILVTQDQPAVEVAALADGVRRGRLL
jgi:hypothetical protein